MLTTCAECQTTFRVTQEHLGLRRGLVRCGQCGVVFNAYDSLLAELVAPPAEPDGKAPSRTASPDEVVAPDTRETPDWPETPELAVMSESVAAAPQPPTQHLDETPEPAPLVTPTPTPVAISAETSDSILLSELPTRIKPVRRVRPRHFHLKLAAAVFLAALLLLQSAIFLRADLAAALPPARPLLRALCQPLNCVVPLPRQLDKTAIAASSLEHDAENKARARLSLLLANRRGQVQTWPHIALTLTDVRDEPVAKRVFSPAEYLGRDAHPKTGMAAGEEREIRLDLDTGTLAATGYALDLAYP